MRDHRQEDVAATLAALFDVTTRTSAAVASALDAHGLTFNTAYALWLADPQERAPSMRELAERMRCAPSNVTFLADQLEARGLIKRAPSPDDKRQRVVVLTDTGRRAREAVVSAFLQACGFEGLADAELQTLRNYAERTRDSM